jgi:hypothetical protein
MRAEHRHELKTNELAAWIANLPQWARDNRNTIIYVSVAAVVIIGAVGWYWYNKNVQSSQKQYELTYLLSRLPSDKIQILQAEGVDLSFRLNQVANRLRELADRADDPQMTALALIEEAKARRTALHYQQRPVAGPELETIINQVKGSYNRALTLADGNRTLKAAAEFGLGLCEEELGDLETAKQIYNDIVENSIYDGTVAAAQANIRLKTMDDYQAPVYFVKSPPKPPPTPMRPPTDLKPADINLSPIDFNMIPVTPNLVPRFTDFNLMREMPNTTSIVFDSNLMPEVPNAPDIDDVNRLGR